jgi:hypothetical protein
MKIGLLPLDERPVNTRYPAMIAAMSGATVLLPPAEQLSALRQPANADQLLNWIADQLPTLDALIVDLEMITFGGLIASRTTTTSIAEAVARLDRLAKLRRRHPCVPLLGFSVITRISNANDNIEEPLYWGTYGTRLYRFSQLSDRVRRGESAPDELAALQAEIPHDHLRDFLWRRHRNHTINLAALHLAAEGIFDLLVISSDDTSPYGMGTREKAWITELAERLDLLAPHSPLLMYPGADEVGCALLARLLNQQAGRTPTIAPIYDSLAGAEITAPYEDGPARITVERQIRAVGGVLAMPDEADLVLAVATPVPRRSEWHPDYAAQERSERAEQLTALAQQIAQRSANGQAVILADIAYPNGADPACFDALREQADLRKLAGYGAWNTAGNTIGTALAQGCAALDATTAERRHAAERFLLRHYVEDWGYQQIVRTEVRTWLAHQGLSDPTPALLAETVARIELQLQACIEQLPGFAGRWQVRNTRLPWQRTFEVDFDLEPRES